MDTPTPEPNRAVSPVKAKMQAWSRDHPEEAAERRAARERIREQRKMAVKLSALIGPEMIHKAAERLDGLLDAQAPVVVNLPPVLEDGKLVSGGQKVEFVDDNKTQLEAIKVVAAYTEGLPVQRQITAQVDFTTLDDERKALMRGSSAVLEALAEIEEEDFDLERLSAGSAEPS